MSRNYKFHDQQLPYFVTFTVVKWIDIFTRKEYKDILIDSLKYCMANKGLEVYAWVIMSNHIHLIVQSEEGKLSDLIRDFKKFIAKNILDKIQSSPESRKEWMLERFKLAAQKHHRNKEYQFWQYGNHAEEIYSTGFMWSKLHYIHLNPVRAGLVAKASEYIYSSAGNYVNNSGLLEIEKVDNPIVNVLDPKSLTLYNLY